ncbi:hypothetical protein BDR26DRAFT_852283, partial [Obelidium mucronatum]
MSAWRMGCSSGVVAEVDCPKPRRRNAPRTTKTTSLVSRKQTANSRSCGSMRLCGRAWKRRRTPPPPRPPSCRCRPSAVRRRPRLSRPTLRRWRLARRSSFKFIRRLTARTPRLHNQKTRKEGRNELLTSMRMLGRKKRASPKQRRKMLLSPLNDDLHALLLHVHLQVLLIQPNENLLCMKTPPKRVIIKPMYYTTSSVFFGPVILYPLSISLQFLFYPLVFKPLLYPFLNKY